MCMLKTKISISAPILLCIALLVTSCGDESNTTHTPIVDSVSTNPSVLGAAGPQDLQSSAEIVPSIIETEISTPTTNLNLIDGIEQPMPNDTRHPSQLMFDTASVRAKSMYNGMSTEAELTPTVANEFLHTVHAGVFPDKTKVSTQSSKALDWIGLSWTRMRDLPLIGQPRPSMKKHLVNATIDCNSNGSSGTMNVASIETDATGTKAIDLSLVDGSAFEQWRYYFFTIDYINCQTDETQPIYNGRAHVYLSANSFGGSPENTRKVTYVYDELRISKDNIGYQIDGAINWPDFNGCDSTRNLTTNAHIQNLGTGQSVLMEELQFKWFDQEAEYCGGNIDHAFTSGNLYLSDHGFATIEQPQTSSANGVQYTPAQYDMDISANGKRAEVRFDYHPDTVDAFGYEKFVYRNVDFRLVNEDLEKIFTIRHTETAFLKGTLLDLEDDDSDGMNNSWEIAHGFDAADPLDADEDPDEDGITNRIEYLTLGWPNRRDLKGLHSDDTVGITSIWNEVRNPNIRITIKAKRDFRYFQQKNVSNLLIVDVDVPGEWRNDQDLSCIQQSGTNQLLCDESELRNGYESLYFYPDNEGLVTFYTTVDQFDYDYWPENNATSWPVIYVYKP